MKSLRLLIIEDVEDHALLMVRELRKGGFDPTFERVETPQELEAALDDGPWDAVISDFRLPGFSGLDALRIVQAKGLDLPFILVSGVIGEEMAVESMKAGAHDFILKANLARLVPTMERELGDAEVRRERRQALEELRLAHAELERRVAERTAELEDANALLRERETLLRAVTEGIPDPVFVKDRESRMLLANPATLATIGKPAEEVLGKNDAEFFDDPAIGRAIMENDRMVMASGSPQVLEETVQTPQGRRVFLSTKLPYRDERGEIIGTIGVARDITERKRAEEALRESEERLFLAVSATELGTWDFNPVTGALNWDTRCKELFGLPPDAEVAYDTFLAGLHPDDREHAHQVVQRTLDPANGGKYDIDYRTVGLTDGSKLHWVHATGQAFFNEAGLAVRFTGTVQDITERKRAEQEIARQVEEFRIMNEDLSRFNRALASREFRMIELKKEVNELCAQIGQQPRYPLEFEKV